MISSSALFRPSPTFLAALTIPLVASPLSASSDEYDEKARSVVVSAPGTNTTALALAEETVAIGYPEERREALFFATMDQTVMQMRQAIAPTLPDNDPGAVAILDEWIAQYTQESKDVLKRHIPDIMAGMTQAYASIFTVGELRDILAFVRTPSGQRYFELSPAVLGEESFARANQAYLDESMALIGPAQRELMQKLERHMADREAKSSPPDT
jgi:hypothetical protein